MLKKTVCELFAWVGWFRLWLEKLDSWWDTVWANQWEPSTKNSQHAYECYIHHFCDYDQMNTDIHEVVDYHMNVIPNHSLLVWGFPCQDYSVARTWAKGIQWKKWVLWRDIKKILEKKKPEFVLLENVDRLLKSPWNQRGRDFWIILACFDELKYDVEWRVINAAEYWCLQRRRRTFIFWYKRSTKYAKSLKKKSFSEILHDCWFFFDKFNIKEETKKKLKEPEYDLNKFDKSTRVLDVSNEFKFEFWNAWIMRDWHIYTEEVIPDYNGPFSYLKDEWVLEYTVDEKYFITADKEPKWKALKWAKKKKRKEWTPQAYTFSEWAIAYPDPLDRPARTMLTSEWTLNRSTHVVLDKKTWKKRILTPLECERINWFDDNWTDIWTDKRMPERFRYFCMWNALVVPLITRMWSRLDEIFENED